MTTSATPNRAATAYLGPAPAAMPTTALAPTVKTARDHLVRSQVGPSVHDEARGVGRLPAGGATHATGPAADGAARTRRPSRSRMVPTFIGLPARLEVRRFARR